MTSRQRPREPTRAQPRGTFYSNGQFVPEEEETSEGINYRWWIMDYGIQREVMQADLGAYLGNNATCRPAQHTQVCPTVSSVRSTSANF